MAFASSECECPFAIATAVLSMFITGLYFARSALHAAAINSATKISSLLEK